MSAPTGPSPARGPSGGAGLQPEDLVAGLVAVMRALGRYAGLEGSALEESVAATLAYARRRLTGDYEVDDFGMDRDFVEHVYLPVLRPVFHRWFRVEVSGLEHIPQGGALLVANHSGTLAWDALMVSAAVHDGTGRVLRMLGADLVFASPVIGEIARRAGSTLANTADAERLLGSGELVGVWPEGFKGIGKPFTERYRLQRFGRGGFVSAAVRSQVPIVPVSIVGAEETYPMLGSSTTLARILGVPYFPLTPTFPWLGVLGMVPLPSKWLIDFGTPVPTDTMDPASADDPMVVFELSDRVRETIQQTLYALLGRRGSVFG